MSAPTKAEIRKAKRDVLAQLVFEVRQLEAPDTYAGGEDSAARAWSFACDQLEAEFERRARGQR
mgnify:CR=1 FL=1